MIGYCLYVTSVAFATSFTYTYDVATPVGTDAPSVIDDRIREVKAALQERLNVEHVFDLTGTEVSHANSGKHTDITCDSVTSTGAISGTTITGSGAISGTTITGSGNATIGGTLGVTGATTFTAGVTANGGVTLGAGDDLVGSTTSDINIGSGNFTAAGATGNTVVGGTLTVTGATTGFWKASGATVFNNSMTAANTFQDLDLSGTVGSNIALVFLEIKASAAGAYAAKPKGYGSATFTAHFNNSGFTTGGSSFHPETANDYAYMTMATDSAGKIQHGAINNTTTYTIKLIGYIK